MTSYALVLSSIWLGSLFIYAGTMKVRDNQVLRFALQATIAGRPVAAASYALPWAEVLIGASVLSGFASRLGAAGAALLGLGFTAFGARTLAAGRQVPCGCSGDVAERVSVVTVIRGVAVAVAGAVLVALEPPTLSPAIALVVGMLSVSPAAAHGLMRAWRRQGSEQFDADEPARATQTADVGRLLDLLSAPAAPAVLQEIG